MTILSIGFVIIYMAVYDTSEKKRVPAYCDRVVYRDSFDGSSTATATSLTHPAQITVVRSGSQMLVFSRIRYYLDDSNKLQILDPSCEADL